MCYFITVGVAEEHARVLRQRLSDAFGADPVSNRSILRRLPANHLTFNLGGVCSCHLYSGSGPAPLDVEKLRRKYEKRGWPAGKIERAIAGKLSAAGRRESFKGLHPDLWRELCGIVGEVGRLSLVVHFYSGAVEGEEVLVSGRRVIDCGRLTGDEDAVPEDVVVEVVA